VENYEIKILDENDDEVPLGTWGEICIKGPGLMQGYWKRQEETAALSMRRLTAHCHQAPGALYIRFGEEEKARSERKTAITMYRSLRMPLEE